MLVVVVVVVAAAAAAVVMVVVVAALVLVLVLVLLLVAAAASMLLTGFLKQHGKWKMENVLLLVVSYSNKRCIDACDNVCGGTALDICNCR